LSELPGFTFQAREGTPAKLKIPVRGTPRPDVKWSKDEEELKAGTRLSFEETPISTMLAISQTGKEDAGVSFVAFLPRTASVQYHQSLT